MADDSSQGGSDFIRSFARQGGTTKTQVMQLDVGGGSANGEVLVMAGQQTMAASVPVVLASNQTPLEFRSPAANNAFGQALSLVASATATLASITPPAAGFQVKGFVAHGTGDGYFALKLSGTKVLTGRIRSTLPTLVVMLPNGIAVAAGQAVTLDVTNESGSTADFEATLLGA